MGGRRIALVTIAALIAAAVSGGAVAQPKDPDGEIEMGSDAAGSAAGSAAAGAAGAASPGTPTGAPAAVPVKDPKIAKKWLAAAQQLMQKGSYLAARNRLDEAKAQFENAVTAYQKALEAGDDPNLYFELANAEDKLGKLDDAVKYLRRVVATQAGVRPDVRKKATAKLEELSTKIGLVTLTVTPAGASITLGGAELGTSPLPEPLVLMPGTYTLSFQADGFQPKEAEIKIEPGSEAERTIELEPVTVIIEPVKPPVIDATLQDDKPPPSKLPLYVGAGVAGAGVLGAGIFGILAVGQHGTFTGASSSTLDRADARINGRRFALITDLSLGTAVVAAGFTAYWYFYKYKRSPKKSEERHPPQVETKLDVIPWVQSQSGGVTIAGWF
jgi:PEGA domain/Tetratricopeptide repeat